MFPIQIYSGLKKKWLGSVLLLFFQFKLNQFSCYLKAPLSILTELLYLKIMLYLICGCY